MLGRTLEGLLAQLHGLIEPVFPVAVQQRLIDQRQHIDRARPVLLVELDGVVEFLNGLRVLLLVQQELAVVVVHVAGVLERLERAAERRHRRGNAAGLVLRYAQLDVRVDEVRVEINRLLVVLGRLRELAEEEVELRAVVVDIRVVLVVADCGVKVVPCSVASAYKSSRIRG